MKIEIDSRSGFCFGVVNAIRLAEEALCIGALATTGDIVHNPSEVERLKLLGLRRVSVLNELNRGESLLIRAHGEPPATYQKARERDIRLVDATCPVVARLQRLVADAAKQMAEVNGQVVILGKRGHAEVIGLTGNANGAAIVIEGEQDLNTVDFNRGIVLFSQTTQSVELFDKIANAIRERALAEIVIHDTVCRQVANREENLTAFARQFDAVIFVSGRNSSNGQVLFNVVKQTNPRSYFIEDEEELSADWFCGLESVGICGATSTPQWLMNNVKCAIYEISG